MAEQQNQKRVALVIGNSKYKHTTALKNPANDAREMAATLERLGFKVTTGVDLDRAAFETVVRSFARDLDGAESGVFFYAGHGLQVDGVNYLLPVDAQIEREADVRFNTLKLGEVLEDMGRSCPTNLIFLDACRNNPLTRSLASAMGHRSVAVGKGLATLQTAPGAFIAFATQPDNVAIDGEGANSPFTTALLRFLEAPGLLIDELMYKVRAAVFDATGRQQVPWHHSSLFNPFRFREGYARLEGQGEGDPWALIKKSGKPGLIRSFVDQFPDSEEANEGRALLAGMEHEEWQRIKEAHKLEDIDDFLAKHPSGQFAKEAHGMISKAQWRTVGIAAAIAAVTGVISALPPPGSIPFWGVVEVLVYVYTGAFLGDEVGIWLNLGILIFGLVFALLIARAFKKPIWRALVAVLIVQLGWFAAHINLLALPPALGVAPAYVESAHVQQLRDFAASIAQDHGADSEKAVKAREAAQSAAAADRKVHDDKIAGDLRVVNLFLGLISGALGAAAVLWAAYFVGAPIRTRLTWILTLSGAALIAAVFAYTGAHVPSRVMSEKSSTFLAAFGSNLWLFVPWQIWVAGCIAWGLVFARHSSVLVRLRGS